MFQTFLYEFFWKNQNISESMFLHNTIYRTLLNSYLLKGESLYKMRTKESGQNYIPKLHSMMTHILISWFKESTKGRKTSFLKELVEKWRPT